MGRQSAMALVCLGVGAAVLSSSAQIILTNQNSRVAIDESVGAYNWVVDGIDHLALQGLWYRVGSAGGESLVGSLPSSLNLIGSTRVDLVYSGAGFDVAVTYSLIGAPLGTGVSELAEQVRIDNYSGGLLDFHLFLYNDFDLGGTTGGDKVQSVDHTLFGYTSALQVDGLNEQQTLIGPLTAADYAEALPFDQTYQKLTDGSPTTLLNSGSSFGPTGSGDLTYAFQWDLTIANGSSSPVIGINKQLDVEPIPEPGTAALGLLGLAGLSLSLLRRRYTL